MPLPEHWATPEDFATLFQYFWHRDFPLDQKAIGARRADWTMHIGVVVRNIADLMGLVPRFEIGGKKDAVLRGWHGPEIAIDEIAVEWEWDAVWGNELKKLKCHKVFSSDKRDDRLLRFGVLITYAYTQDITNAYDHVEKLWKDAQWPLLLILVDFVKSKKFVMGKEFKNINVSVFDSSGRRKKVRVTPAFPWNVEGTRFFCADALSNI